MRRSSRLSPYLACAAAAFLLAGCGAFKSLGKEGKKDASPPPAEVKVTAPKGDSVGTEDAGLKHADSSKAPSAYASELYLETLDNYLKVSPDDEKTPEILVWKGNHLYNQGRFEQALPLYEDVRKRFPDNALSGEAAQMAAQSYAQLGKLEEAEKTYRSMLKGKDATSIAEAKERLAQSVYLQAEKAEKEGKLQTASEIYQRIPREFPAADIAPVAMFNAGVMQEKQKKWKDAIAIYSLFFDAYFESKLLSKVLFREAKCREQDGQWQAAGDKYLNLTRAHPESPEAEPSMYNAGFAYLNGKLQDSAARAFEAYAKRYPQKEEAPNLLFRAVEIFGELQNWDKVAELQTLFTRRYATDKGRLVQALCMGGTAAFQRGRREEAIQLMGRVVSEFAAMKSSDPTARFYAAQAQHTLGEIAARKMREAPVRAGSYDADLKYKTGLLKSAVDEYLKVLDYRIVDWALRAAYSLGLGFEDFGTGVYSGPRKAARSPSEQLDREEDAMAALSAAYAKAQQQYLQVLTIGRKQEVNNRWVGEASGRLVAMATRYEGYQIKAMAQVPVLIRVDAGTPEKAIAGKLQQIGRIAPYQEQGMKYFMAFLDIAQEYELDPKAGDTLGTQILGSLRALGSHYADAAGLARSAPFPAGFHPMERFFYQVKLLQEGIPNLEDKAIGYFKQGLDFAARYNLTKDPAYDSLRISLGRALYIQAKCLDLLSYEALVKPPIPPEAGPEQRKTFQEKLETVGYQLQDQALDKYHRLVEKVVAGMVPVEFGEMAFARLYQIEPDKWTRSSEQDTVMDVYTGKEWSALPALTVAGWPSKEDPAWKKVRKGVVPRADFPPEVTATPRFLWCGDKGLGPKIDTTVANYIPWKQVWVQTPFTLPPHVLKMDLEVVAQQEWTILIDKDTVLNQKSLQGPWYKGAFKDVWPLLSKRLAPGEHFLRIAAQNLKPAEGFGVWARLRIRYKMPGTGAVFPWNQAAVGPEYLKSLLERGIPIPNFTNRPGGQ
ncbi:MAG TPA: tetratricopeptide repeat protein [Fibrobacteria bacterium]|nr:tetratricopeptide repeat protein [Fibrobacteria bacterium]